MTDHDDRRSRRLESVISDLLRRTVEAGMEKAAEAPESLRKMANDLKLPREAVHYLLAQVEETKSGLFRAVAKETREFLEHTNLSGELQKLLTSVQFEVNTTIRFRPNEPKSEPGTDEGTDHDSEELGGERTDGNGEPPTKAAFPRPLVSTRIYARRLGRRARRPFGRSASSTGKPEGRDDAP